MVGANVVFGLVLDCLPRLMFFIFEHVQTGFSGLFLLEKEIFSLCTSLVKEFHELYLRKAPLPVIDCVRKNVENIPLGALFIAFSRRKVNFLKLSSLAPAALAEELNTARQKQASTRFCDWCEYGFALLLKVLLKTGVVFPHRRHARETSARNVMFDH